MLKHKQSRVILAIIFCAFCLTPNVFAATCDGVETNLIGCPDDGNAIGHIISMVLNVLTVGMGVAATVGMVIVGTKYMMSRDSEDQVRLAKKRFLEIVVGMALWAVFFVGIQLIIPGGMLNPDELNISANTGNHGNSGGDEGDQSGGDNGGSRPPSIVNYPAKQQLLSYTHGDGTKYDYWLNVPENATGNMPLVIFLHGDGEASNSTAVKNTPQVQAMMRNKNFISVAPVGHGTNSTDWVSNSTPAILRAISDKTANEYQIDKQRIYIFGFSRGTIGAWNLIDKNPNYFAAGVLVSCPPVGVQAKNFVNTPIRAYSGTKGQEAGYVNSMSSFVNTIKSLGGDAVYSNTEYQGLDHSDMSSALKYDQIFNWMLGQRKK